MTARSLFLLSSQSDTMQAADRAVKETGNNSEAHPRSNTAATAGCAPVQAENQAVESVSHKNSTHQCPRHSWEEVLVTHLSTAQQTALAKAHIGIAGAGGLGSNAAFMLARSGIGHLVLADHDTVSLSNLNRQAFWPDDLGQPKVLALRERLRRLRPDLDVTAHVLRLTQDNLKTIFRNCNIVLEAVDEPALKRNLTEALLQSGRTVIAASGLAGWGGPAMSIRKMGRLIVVGDFAEAVSEQRPAMAPRVIMAAAMQADAVLSLILGNKAETTRT